MQCHVDGKFYAENEKFASGIGDCALCNCANSGLSCDIINCQEIESTRARRNVMQSMQNEDLDQIKNRLLEKVVGAENSENPPEFNIIVNGLVHKQIVQQHNKLTHKKRIYLNANAEVDNFTPHTLNVTTTPSKFHLMRVNLLMINKTYGISFKPSTGVLGHTIQTDLDSTGIDPIVLYEFEPEVIESAAHQIDVPPYSRLSIKNHFYQYRNEIDYLLDFEVDEASTITFADRTINLKEIVMQNSDSLPIGDADHLQLEFVDGQVVLKNFPAKLKTMYFGIEMVLERFYLDEIDN